MTVNLFNLVAGFVFIFGGAIMIAVGFYLLSKV